MGIISYPKPWLKLGTVTKDSLFSDAVPSGRETLGQVDGRKSLNRV